MGNGIGALDALIEETSPLCPWCGATHWLDEEYRDGGQFVRARKFMCDSTVIQADQKTIGYRRERGCIAAQLAAVMRRTIESADDSLEVRGEIWAHIEEGRTTLIAWDRLK